MKNKKKIFCFDIDGTICTQRKGDYKNAKPYLKVKEAINYLYDNGHTIIFFTSRFMNRYSGKKSLIKKYGYTFTKKQLIKWGFKFHELKMYKPFYDIMIDDKSLFYKKKWHSYLIKEFCKHHK